MHDGALFHGVRRVCSAAVVAPPHSSNPSGPTTNVESQPDRPTPVAEIPSEAPPLRARGEQIGRYVVIDTIGHGGMGVVYAAWDPQLDRRIALKLVSLASRTADRPDYDSESHRLRLLREAQALARLEHPNVVKVHDVGVCRSGAHGAIGEEQVFIAMEQVLGRSLRDWLRERRRSLRAVLEVFIAAGRGLVAAHEAGLVHRDFKPDNVLVGDAGEVKVVDFGLARDDPDQPEHTDRVRARVWAETDPAVAAVLGRADAGSGNEFDGDPRLAPESDGMPVAIEREPSAGHSVDSRLSGPRSLLASSTGNITATGTILGTPAYMAPEQHARAAIDARCDQYAFCVSLWEAVYGKRPFSGRRSDVLASRKRKLAIRESSRGLRVPRSLRSSLLRGLSPDPRKRFASVEALLTELEGQLGRRRRWLIPAAVASALLGGLIVTLTSSSLSLSRDTVPCAAPVERLTGVWDDPRRAKVRDALLASELPYASDTWERVSTGLDDYRAQWLAAEVEACESTHLRAEHDAAWLERRIECLDDRRRALASLTDQLVRGDPLTVEHAAQAVGSLAPIEACERERVPADLQALPNDPHLRLRVERQLDQLADARALLGAGHLADGLAAARVVLASGPSREWPALAAEALFVIGEREADVEGDPLAEQRSLHAAASAALRSGQHRRAALSWSRLARGLIRTGTIAEAERWLAHADGLAAGLIRDYGEDPPLTADLEHTRAQLRFAEGDFAGAEAHARRRLALLREFYGADNPRVADGLNNLGVTVYMQHRKDEAIEAYREALAIIEAVEGTEHPAVATMHNNIGVVSTDRTLYASALVHYERAVEIRRRVYARTHEHLQQSLINLANVHLFSGNAAVGLGPGLEAVLAAAASLDEQRDRSKQSEVVIAERELALVPELLRLGRLFAGAGEHRNALASHARALALVDRIPDQPLDGCRADLLLGIETSARALGRDGQADWALTERSTIPVEQPAWPRRCIDEHGHWRATRAK